MVTPQDQNGQPLTSGAVTVTFLTLDEIPASDNGPVAQSFSFADNTYTITGTSSNVSQSFTLQSNSSTNLALDFTLFQQPDIVNFGGSAISANTSIVKWGLHIPSWTFNNPTNRLRLTISLQSADGSFSNGFDVEPQTDPRQTIYVLRTMSTTVSTNATHFNGNVDTYTNKRNTGLDTAA